MSRALGVVRLFVETDHTTSPERQREIIEAEASKRGSEIVGWAEDLDVSASKVHPMDRPDLCQWLSPGAPDRYRAARYSAPPAEYDEILFWRLDRIVRSSLDWADLMRWAAANGKVLASATEPIDLATHLGRIVANLIVGVAEMESGNTSERVLGAHQYLRQAGRFAGGKAPYGCMKVPAPDGKGYTLVESPETLPVLREAIDRVLADEAVNSVIADFNRRGIASPQDSQRTQPEGQPWRAESLRRVLRNPAMLGHAVHKGKSVTGPDGMPVLRGLPLVTQSKFDQIQHALDQLARPGAGPFSRTQTPSLLLGVAWCARCSEPGDAAKLYRGTRGSWNREIRIPHYICERAARPAQHGDRCKAPSILASVLDQVAADAFLAHSGEREQIERVWIAGEDHADELATVRAALENCRAEYDRGGYAYPGGQADYDERTARLSDRLAALAVIPSRPSRYEPKPTGRTIRQAWEAATVAERRKLMLDTGYRIEADRMADGRLCLRLVIDPDLERRVSLAAAGMSTERQLGEPFDFGAVRRGVNMYLVPGEDVAARVRAALANRCEPLADGAR